MLLTLLKKLFIGRLLVATSAPLSWRVGLVGLSIASLIVGTTTGNYTVALPDHPIFQSFPFMSQPRSIVSKPLLNQADYNVPSIDAHQISLSYKQRLVPKMYVPTRISQHFFEEESLIRDNQFQLIKKNRVSRVFMKQRGQTIRTSSNWEADSTAKLAAGWTVSSTSTPNYDVPVNNYEMKRYYTRSKSPRLVRYISRSRSWKQVYPPKKIMREKQIQDSITFITPLPTKPLIK